MPLKELEDFDWFPQKLRTYQMDAIGFMVKLLHSYKPIVPFLKQLIHRTNANEIIDLCSGSGLPAMYIHKQLQLKIPYTLTDKYPQQKIFPNNITYLKQSLNIHDLQPNAAKVYTMYNAFHHFEDAEKIALINRFKNANASLCIVEIISPTLLNIIMVFLASTILQLIITPFIKPFSLLRMVFTYIIPINIITVFVDGIISVLKSKTKKKYQNLLNEINSATYKVEVKTVFNFPSKIVLIIATPL